MFDFRPIFPMQKTQWASTIILVDADYLGNTALDFSVNFEKMIGRRIPEGDLYHWLDCIALDGGLRPGENDIQIHILHSKSNQSLKGFKPSDIKEGLNGLSFKDNLGYFSLFTFPVEEIVSMDEFFLQSMTMLADAKEVNHLMVVGDMDAYGEEMINIYKKTDGKEITLFSMRPLADPDIRHEILGYSLMSALGIKSEELL